MSWKSGVTVSGMISYGVLHPVNGSCSSNAGVQCLGRPAWPVLWGLLILLRRNNYQETKINGKTCAWIHRGLGCTQNPQGKPCWKHATMQPPLYDSTPSYLDQSGICFSWNWKILKDLDGGYCIHHCCRHHHHHHRHRRGCGCGGCCCCCCCCCCGAGGGDDEVTICPVLGLLLKELYLVGTAILTLLEAACKKGSVLKSLRT